MEIERSTNEDGELEFSAVTLRFNIIGVSDAGNADELLAGTAPETINGLVIDKMTTERIADKGFEGVVTYKKDEDDGGEEEPELSNLTESEFSFDTTGGTQHITQSYQTVGSYAPPNKTAPNHNGAIGVSKDEVSGVDIVIPSFKFQMKRSGKGRLNAALISSIAALSGCVNSTDFFGFAPGEVLFLGGTGTNKSKGEFDLTYNFEVSKNASNLQIGNITVQQKAGFDYMWAEYLETKDENSGQLCKQPRAVYVERVYRTANLNGLT
ncbi:hypothetical protein FACS1894214_0990 [Planctomycetales bacterium]|nr:hypothetical protein FACS1894214_0990 [Planctomycetales bacterium]